MIINFEVSTKTLWHSDCEKGDYSPPMREVSHDNDEGRSLLECARCKKKGYYPYGGAGQLEVEEIKDRQ